MLLKSRAIVLAKLKYNDTAEIATLFTEARGAVPYIVRIPKTRRAGIQNILLQPLNLLLIEWNDREGQHLHRLRNLESLYPYRSLPYVPVKAAMGQFVAEFLYYALRGEHEGGAIFDYLLKALQWLDEVQEGYANFHVVLPLRLSHFLGIMPELGGYSEGYCFDLQNGRFVAQRPSHVYYVEGGEAAMLSRLAEADFGNMQHLGLNRRKRQRLLELANDYYRLHVPGFPRLRSLDVLKEVFDD